ncbi:MAG TPA: hypothetical protein PLJ35_16770 [Anaerolineae bacterium]|nr:hypothetical protein [Anaerolineae bacterium]HOR00466.1 hypothetical protein [Anaerolineae bacterium]HPL29326.1 hypothetical protein [Anaerolineae bacterium]
MNPRLTTLISLAMAALSWLGLVYLMVAFPPDTPGIIILFLGLLFLATSFASAPLFRAVHHRLAYTPEDEVRRQGAVWRESAMMGLFFALCAWLRSIRVLSWANTLLLVAVLVLTEVLLLARERE